MDVKTKEAALLYGIEGVLQKDEFAKVKSQLYAFSQFEVNVIYAALRNNSLKWEDQKKLALRFGDNPEANERLRIAEANIASTDEVFRRIRDRIHPRKGTKVRINIPCLEELGLIDETAVWPQMMSRPEDVEYEIDSKHDSTISDHTCVVRSSETGKVFNLHSSYLIFDPTA